MGDRCPIGYGQLDLHCWEDDRCIFCGQVRDSEIPKVPEPSHPIDLPWPPSTPS